MNESFDHLNDIDMPEVNENAINAVNDIMTEKQEKIKADDKHVLGEDGKPLLNKDGTPKKKRGRKKGQVNSMLGVKDKKDEDQDIGSMDAAVTISGLLEIAQVKLISEEFIYSEMERVGNITAWKATLDYYGGLTLSPPQALVLSHLQIILIRANQPKTNAKLGLVKAWFKNKAANLKFTKKDKKHGSYDDSRKDAEREDNTGKADSEKLSEK